ncbi:CotH kinase family protein [Altibacter sp. HG106]|uniref:CotH kinase family protein n=1 Tax=Altibacter sp. HG106 TaxID=3023937 RepID=UPI002350C12C|nr:CotH kinase family protein [Altibacter sp. HG106]MDC7993555.1 CotH kinase family protein [Altibacter sp. HG106]
MKKIYTLYLVGFILALPFASCAQEEITATDYSFGVDHKNQLIVWNASAERMGISPKTIMFDVAYQNTEAGSVDPKNTVNLQSNGKKYQLFTTTHPVVRISYEADTLKKHPRVPATFSYYDADTAFAQPITMRLRGNISLQFPKKNFDIEFQEEGSTTESEDVLLKNLREDDDYVLDGMYNEALRLRAKTALAMWQEQRPWTYSKKGKSGPEGFYVDLFVNDTYRGIYYLGEQVDRKLMRLKKKDGDTVRGELFKAGYYADGTKFIAAPDFKNSLPTWAGFEMEYPYEDYVAFYDNLHAFMKFLTTSSASEFSQHLEQWLDVENAIDYFLFVNAIRATDNLGKNFYFGRYDNDEPYLFIPWDVDGSFGVIQAGKRIPTTNDILDNGLFKRLWEENPEGYRQKVARRWFELREDLYATKTVLQQIEEQYQRFESEQVYAREALIWENTFTEENKQYLTQWITDRFQFLDSYFEAER